MMTGLIPKNSSLMGNQSKRLCEDVIGAASVPDECWGRHLAAGKHLQAPVQFSGARLTANKVRLSVSLSLLFT